ncbi:MAG: L-seryl-tRNA(Sec) selenium transferase [Acidobacteria bacterium]|nr:L-seryl-tRNA(Sec) selenium transferase [Acidobacteriota bacterium]
MARFRAIPSIDQLRQRHGVRALESTYGRDAVVDALRDATGTLRQQLASDGALGGTLPPDLDDATNRLSDLIERDTRARLANTFAGSLRPVINATGVIVHTNLGRAPLAQAALDRIAAIASGYGNLEYDLERGGRGRRDVHAERLLVRLTGAQAAVVVNNNAAATLLALAALASGREVVVSRGELVEIGGGFRVPDVMAQSGAILREVGTTNRTRAADYAAAIGEKTALMLRVHPSNFRIEGFVERPALQELVALGRRFNVRVAEDLGSGLLWRVDSPQDAGQQAVSSALRDEPSVQSSVAAGADIVCFSGDKLLGGPQAGIIVGGHEPIAAIRKHPLMRALRVDKMTYAALEATLIEYVAGRAPASIPVLRMLAQSADEIERRARAVREHLTGHPSLRVEILDGWSTIGGGSAPGAAIPTRLLAIGSDAMSANELEAKLRAGDPPVIARIEEGRVVLDLRTVLPDQDAVLARLLGSVAPN